MRVDPVGMNVVYATESALSAGGGPERKSYFITEEKGDALIIRFNPKRGITKVLEPQNLQINKELNAIANQNTDQKRVVLDLAGVELVSAAFFGALVNFTRKTNLPNPSFVGKDANKLVLSSVHPNIEQSLNATDLAGQYEIYETSDDAVMEKKRKQIPLLDASDSSAFLTYYLYRSAN